jgi:aminopeptidase
MTLRHPRSLAGGLAVAIALLLSGCAQPVPPPPEMASSGSPASKADTRALAAKLVHQVAGIKEDEIVVVAGGVRDHALLEDIAIEVRKAGAFALVTDVSDDYARRSYEEVPVKFDSQKPLLDYKITEIANVFITVDPDGPNDALHGVSAERIAKRAAAGSALGEMMMKRNIRQVNLGNGLVPSADNAKQWGVTTEQASAIYWKGVNTDYEKLEWTANSVSKALMGSKLRVTNPNGTDITMDIAGRPVYTSDGVISDEDIKRGGAAVMVYLPAGEVYVTPVPGTAEGRIVADHYFFQGKTIEKLELTFSKGKLAGMKAASGLDAIKGLYDATDGDAKSEFAVVDIGINPDVELVPRSKMVGWMPAGMVTMGIGNNQWAGGSNTSTFGLFPFLPGSTVEVDGRVIVKDGKLVK